MTKKTIKKMIKDFIEKSSESYYFTTKEEINTIAKSIAIYEDSYLNSLTNEQLQVIIEMELKSDIELFDGYFIEPEYINTLIKIAKKFNISKKKIVKDREFILCYVATTMEEYLELIILNSAYTENEESNELVYNMYKYVDINKLWEDKFFSYCYKSQSNNCIFEFPWNIR